VPPVKFNQTNTHPRPCAYGEGIRRPTLTRVRVIMLSETTGVRDGYLNSAVIRNQRGTTKQPRFVPSCGGSRSRGGGPGCRLTRPPPRGRSQPPAPLNASVAAPPRAAPYPG
jgi:hypothetical protein